MQIQLNGISCTTIIGNHDYERNSMQEVIIDISCNLYEIDWIANDTIGSTVCFDALIAHIKDVVANTSYRLLESLAQHVSQTIFLKFKQVEALDISMFKTQLCGVGAASLVTRLCKKREFKVAIAIGSNNIHLPQQQLIVAIEILNSYVDNIKVGGFYETKPVGFMEQRNFYNTVITGTTTLMPNILLSKLKKIEKLMGKEEIMVDGPRIIDLDLILFDDLIYQYNFIKIPHAAMHKRDFVLQPLADIAPDWQHPILNKTIQELLAAIPQNERSIFC